MAAFRGTPFRAGQLAASLLLLLVVSTSTPVSGAPERAFALEAVPRVAAFPKAIAVGSNGAVEVQVEMPLRGGKPRLSTFEGGVGEATSEEGLWYARYKPPSTRGPGFDLILARSETGAVGVGVVELHAQAKVVLDGQPPRTPVTVRIGGRDFGPFVTDASGEANIQIEVPPGIDEVEVLAPDKPATKEKLAIPPLRRMFIAAPLAVPAGKPFEVTAVAIDRKGRLLEAKPSVSAQRAVMRSMQEVGPGVWKIVLVPEGGPVVLHVKSGTAKGRAQIMAPWPKKPLPTPVPDATPAPDVIAIGGTPSAFPPAPSCEELKIAPGAIVTAARLRTRIEEASRESDLIARRDRLIGLECVFPDEHAIRLQLTAAWLLLGDNRTAVETITPLLQDEEEIHDEHRALGLSYQASALLRLGDLDAAAESSRSALTLLPGLYSASYTLGEALFLKKDFNGAQAALMSAYRAAPGFASEVDHSILAEILEAKNAPAEALPHRIALARLDPNDLDRWRQAARSAESGGSWARAHEAWLVIASSTLPGFAANGEALSGVARAAVAAPADGEIARLETGIASERAGNMEKAIFLLEKAVAENGSNLAARYHYARLLTLAGKHPAAAQQITSVLNGAPRWVPALVLAGDIERARGETERALGRYREAAGMTPPAPMSTVARWRLSELSKLAPAP